MIESIMNNSCWNEIGVWGNNSCTELRKNYHCRNCQVFINSGKELFEKSTPAGYLNEWTEIIAKEKIEDEKNDSSCLIFRLGSEWFGVDSTFVAEVTEPSQIHSLPHQKSIILIGIVNVRGEIKLAVELNSLLGVESSEVILNKNNKIYLRHIVIKRNKESWVIPVDEIFGVTKFNEKKITSLPATAKSAKTNYLKGFLKTGNIEAGIITSDVLFEAISKQVF